MALEGTQFSDTAKQHLKAQWLSKLAGVYTKLTATTMETDLSRFTTRFTIALNGMDDLMKANCEAECSSEMNLIHYNSSVSYQDTVLVQHTISFRKHGKQSDLDGNSRISI